MAGRPGRLQEAFSTDSSQLSSEQLAARERWRNRWNLPILLAALLPLFITSPKTRAVELAVGIGSWLVFVIDLVVQRRIEPDYLHHRNGRIDLAIVILTFPYYLLPGASGYTVILVFARLARVVRLLLATAGLRRFAARLGKVMTVAALMVTVCALAAYQAEHASNPGFATVGDAFWWAIVTLTTVGYGDIVPQTAAGRLAGVALMFTGVAVLGVLAGSLASLFRLDPPDDSHEGAVERPAKPPSLHSELATLQADVRTIDRRLGEIAERAQTEPAVPPPSR